MNGSVVIINLGSGNLQEGCPEITAQIISTQGYPSIQIRGSLPPNLKLAELHRQWQLLYREYYQETRSLKIDEGGITHFSEIEFRDLCEQLNLCFNAWLNHPSFAAIDRRLSRFLDRNEEIQIVITTDHPQLRRLPWQLWNILTDYPYAEIVLSTLEYYGDTTPPTTTKGKVRVLAVFGEDTGIDLKPDRTAIENLPGAETHILEQPDSQQFNESLWETQGWDILFFAGHSHTEDNRGHLHLNAHSTLSLDGFQLALKTAVSQGLKLAIFNSCDGLGLTQTLANSGLPCAIVMREAIPNAVAEEFFRGFLIAFAGGKSLHLAIREARERLEKLESCYPCASWLPVLCQPPTLIIVAWEKWRGKGGMWGWWCGEKTLLEKALLWTILGSVGTQAFLQFNPLELWMLLSLWKQTQDKRIVTDVSEDALLVVSYETTLEDETIEQLLQQKTLNLELLETLTNHDADFTLPTVELASGIYQFEVEVVKGDNHKITYSFPGKIDVIRPTITEIEGFTTSVSSPRINQISIVFSESIDEESFGKEDIYLISAKTGELNPSEFSLETINERTIVVQLSETISSDSLEVSVNLEGVKDRSGNEGNLTISRTIEPKTSEETETVLETETETDSSPEEIEVISGKIEIIIEQVSFDIPSSSDEVPGFDFNNPLFSDQYQWLTSFLIESNDFHISIDTQLVISPQEIETVFPTSTTISESDLQQTYQTVIIEETHIEQWSNQILVKTETNEDTLFRVSDTFEIEAGEKNLNPVLENSLNDLPPPENYQIISTEIEQWISIQMTTRFAFQDSLKMSPNETETIKEQIYKTFAFETETLSRFIEPEEIMNSFVNINAPSIEFSIINN